MNRGHSQRGYRYYITRDMHTLHYAPAMRRHLSNNISKGLLSGLIIGNRKD